MVINKGFTYKNSIGIEKVVISDTVNESCASPCKKCEGIFRAKSIKTNRTHDACVRKVKEYCKPLKNNIRRL